MTTVVDTIASPPSPAGALQRTLAARQIDAFAGLAQSCARPPRRRHPLDPRGPSTCAFFLIDAASVAWVQAAAAHPRIRLVGVTTEAKGTSAAIEASIAAGRPQIVICGAGPGAPGHLRAVPGARAQGATILLLVPTTPPRCAGSVDVPESSREPLHEAGAGLFDDVMTMEDVAQMPRILQRLRHLFTRPQGAVVQLGVPSDLLRRRCPPLPDLGAGDIALPAPSARPVTELAALLRGPGGPPAFLFGSGAVPFRDRLADLVERCGAVHCSTPQAAGIVPGSLGTIGNAAGGDVPRRLRELDVRCVVVLGARPGAACGGANAELLPSRCHVVHVDVAPDVVAGNALATCDRHVTFIACDIGELLDAMSAHERGVT